MLNRMEAYTMLGEYDKAIDNLLVYLSVKYGVYPSCGRSTYTQTSSENYQIYTPFYGMSINQLALVKILLGFRRQEFLHEGLRWFDIRRFYISVKTHFKSINSTDHWKKKIPENFCKYRQKPLTGDWFLIPDRVL